MLRHRSRILYGTLLFLGFVLMNVLLNLNTTKTQNVTENLNITKTQNVTEKSNITITQNMTENLNFTNTENVTCQLDCTEDSSSTMTPSTSVNTTTESMTNTTLKIIQSLTDVKYYNKNLRPNLGEKAVEVEVEIDDPQIISVSDFSSEMTVNMRVYQFWYDPRLQFTPINNVTELILVRDFAKLIWLPDTYISNSKSLNMLFSDSTLEGATIELYKDGYLFYDNIFTTTVNCPMDLRYFPVDQQICKLTFRSYHYYNKDLKLKSLAVDEIPNISLSTFTLTSYNASKNIVLNGTDDELVCEFRFKRILGYYINQIYMPSFMIVVISWLPFWLNRNDHYARVGLGVTTVLTITTMVISTNESLPKTSYIKAIDVYLIVCFLMVFLAMIEFATIGHFESEQRENPTKKKKSITVKSLNGKVPKLRASSKREKKRDIAWIDQVSRVLFPAVFIAFNLIYGGILFYISNYINLD